MSLEDAYAKLTLEDEDQGIEIDGEDKEVSSDEYRFCLVGRFFSDKPINFTPMKNTLASIRRPIKGVCIKDLGASTYIFQFFHPLDMNRVVENGPWTFDQHLLMVKHLGESENPTKVDLFEACFWVQVYDVPAGYRSEKILQHIGNYTGSFLRSDPNNFSWGWKTFLRIRIRMDVRIPLKRKMKLKKAGGEWIWITFKYECLPTFYYVCGKIGHSDQYCEKVFASPNGQVERPYGPWLRAPSHWSIEIAAREMVS